MCLHARGRARGAWREKQGGGGLAHAIVMVDTGSLPRLGDSRAGAGALAYLTMRPDARRLGGAKPLLQLGLEHRRCYSSSTSSSSSRSASLDSSTTTA